MRHGVTDATTGKLFSGGLASSNPPLNDEGREQARATGEWLAPMADTFDALVASPVRRTRETAEILAGFLGLDVAEEPGLAEMEFGTWDGLSFTEVREKWPDELSSWLGDLDAAPHGGESFRAVEKRVLEGRDRLLAAYAGKTVVVVSHVTPIKTLVAHAVGAPLDAVYRMELAPASVTVLSYFNVGERRRGPDEQPAALQRPPHRRLRLSRFRAPRRPRRAGTPVRVGAPDLDLPAEGGQAVGEGGGRGRRLAVLEEPAHEAALGRLVEVADHRCAARPTRGAPARWPPAARGRARDARRRRRSSSAGRRRARRRPRRARPGRARARQWAETTPTPGSRVPPESR